MASRGKRIVTGVRAKSTRPTRVAAPPKLMDGEAINPRPSQARQAYKRASSMQRQSNRVRHGLR